MRAKAGRKRRDEFQTALIGVLFQCGTQIGSSGSF
jgi:hypothetical protein